MPRERKPKKKFDDPFGTPQGIQGPDPITYDEDIIRELAASGCTLKEIAHICGFGEPHFHELRKRYPDIQKAIDLGRSTLHKSLRKKQVEVAMDGNPQMLIHLGKAILGQNDKIAIDHNVQGEIEYEITFGDPVIKDKDKITETSPETT